MYKYNGKGDAYGYFTGTKVLSSFKLIGSGKKVCDISSDIVVPDTKEDILRVIMTNAEYSIRSRMLRPAG